MQEVTAMEEAEISLGAAGAGTVPEFDGHGRRKLFRVYHNGGAPVSFGSRRFKETRKQYKADRLAERKKLRAKEE